MDKMILAVFCTIYITSVISIQRRGFGEYLRKPMDFRDEYYHYKQERAAKAALRDATSADTVGEAALSETDTSADTVGEDIQKCSGLAYQYAGFLYFTNLAFGQSVNQFFSAIDAQPKAKFEKFAERLAQYRSVVLSYDIHIKEFRKCLVEIDSKDWEKWIKEHPVKKTE